MTQRSTYSSFWTSSTSEYSRSDDWTPSFGNWWGGRKSNEAGQTSMLDFFKQVGGKKGKVVKKVKKTKKTMKMRKKILRSSKTTSRDSTMNTENIDDRFHSFSGDNWIASDPVF